MNTSRPSRDIRNALARDASRRARREPGNRSFWRSLNVLGMVGWPIALAAGGGALLGHYLDERFGTGVRFTLIFLVAGTTLGSLIAWTTVRPQE